MNELDYEILGSSSKGNSVRIEDVLVDVGLPFNKIHRALYKVKYILLTHIHSDHIRASTLKKIKELFPNITIIGNWQVAQKYEVDIIANAGYPVEIGDYSFEPFEAPHDVIVYGWCWKVNDNQVMYVTDTYSLENCPRYLFDYFFLESNHDERKVEAIDRKSFGYDAYAGAKRHLSTQQAKEFYFLNRKDSDSVWIPLHKSERFY